MFTISAKNRDSKSADTVNVSVIIKDHKNLWYPQSQFSGHSGRYLLISDAKGITTSTLSSERYKCFHAMIIYSSASCSWPDAISAVWEIIAWVCLSDELGWTWTRRFSSCSSSFPRIVVVKSDVLPSSFLVIVTFSCDPYSPVFFFRKIQ
jgi:hypothetical protein